MEREASPNKEETSPWQWRGTKRRRSWIDEFFEEGDHVCKMSKTDTVDDDEEEEDEELLVER